jgi:hypothetical protein
VSLFNAILRTQNFPPVWKQVRVTYILKPGKDTAPASSYRQINLLDAIGKVFEIIILSRILSEVSGRGLLRDDLRPKHSTSLQLAHLVERVSRNFGCKRLTDTVFVDIAKAFDTVWVDGLAYKLMALSFPSYLVETILSYLRGWTSKRPSKRLFPLAVACGLAWLRKD